MPTGSGPNSPTPTNNVCDADRKNSIDSNPKLKNMSYDPTQYIQRARVTRPAPPKPSCNPLQFVQIKPSNLYQNAQEQLKRAEEVKKVKEIKKEEPEDWQSNLENWKSSRRKRVEHIIDRVVEVKKLELEEHDRTRRKSKTFSEMLEERGSSRRKLSALTVYAEDDSNDLSDLGIGTSSTSGKSSLSEDCDNQSVISDNPETERQCGNLDNEINNDNRDYISSPGYDTSSSTAITNSPDLCEYTYEGAIQDYKTRISRATIKNYTNGCKNSTVDENSNISEPENNSNNNNNNNNNESYQQRRISSSKIENRLINFEINSTKDINQELSIQKLDLPKVDITKRKEIFEKDKNSDNNELKRISDDFSNSKSIKERLLNLEKKTDDIKKSNRLSGDISSIKDRLQNLEKQNQIIEKQTKIEIPVVPLKERLTSLHNAVSKEEIKKPIMLVNEHELEILRNEELIKRSESIQQEYNDEEPINGSNEILNIQDDSNVDTDREDSGIHTTDVSCSVSQTDEQPELVNEESSHHINIDTLVTENENEIEPNEDDINENKENSLELTNEETNDNSTIIQETTISDLSLISQNELDATVSMKISDSIETKMVNGNNNLVMDNVDTSKLDNTNSSNISLTNNIKDNYSSLSLITTKHCSLPNFNPCTHPESRPRNIFEFLKRNFETHQSNNDDNDFISIENSKFYIKHATQSSSLSPSSPISVISSNQENIINENFIKSDSIDSDTNFISDINDLIDEELTNLDVEDTRL